MRYAIISDIHANLEALERSLGAIDEVGVDEILCLGDIVGYGANPNECVDLVRKRGVTSIIGNHDCVACGKSEPNDFNPMARSAILWTRSTLSRDNKDYLLDLPDKREIEDLLIVHGAISDPDKYIFSEGDTLREFELMQNRNICFFGHTHVRVFYVLTNDEIRGFYDDGLRINKDGKYLINPGSVGQPRDRDHRVSFLIYDDERETVEYTRLEYDIASAQKKIIEAGLDRRLAYRLSLGI